MGTMYYPRRQQSALHDTTRDAALDLIDALKITYVDLSDLSDNPRIRAVLKQIRAALSKAEARV